MAYHRPLSRSKTMNNDTTFTPRNNNNNQDIEIQDEGYMPLKTKFVPNKALNDGRRGINSAVSHGLLMQYQAPVFIVKRPKYIRAGPFDIYDVPDLRTLKKTLRKDYHSQVLNKKVNLKFYEDLELEEYFSKKDNWLNTAKFMNTNSFLSAVNVYLPLVKNKSVNNLAKKYTSERNSRVSSSMTIPSLSQSRIDSSRLGF